MPETESAEQYDGRRKQAYDFPVDMQNPANAHRLQFEQISEGSRVLDIGCHTGILGKLLIDRKNCSVVGIDSDADALKIASEYFAAVRQVNLEQPGWSAALMELGPFDHIIFGDVLEHTTNPARILQEARALLRSGNSGDELKHSPTVIVSVPNVVNLRVRIKIMLGDFDYTESGILDRTHLRFFTRKTARELLVKSGYDVVFEEVAGVSLPHWLLRRFPGLLGYQFVLAGTPDGS